MDHWVTKGLLALLFGCNDWFFHPQHDVVTIVMVLVGLDTLTGFMKAYQHQVVSSSGFFRFALKILIYFILLATGALLDKLVLIEGIIRALTVTAVFLSITEAISILENISGMGFLIPKKLLNLLKFAQGSDNDIDKKKLP
jgi:toxin secretion/phage lysis holin